MLRTLLPSQAQSSLQLAVKQQQLPVSWADLYHSSSMGNASTLEHTTVGRHNKTVRK